MYEEPESLTSDYVALHGVAPINSYIKNKTLTPASYNFAGLPAGSYAQCTLGKTQYCFPVDTDPGPEMFYNIGMFKAAGLTPPTNWAQVLTDANKLTTKSVQAFASEVLNQPPTVTPCCSCSRISSRTRPITRAST